MRVIELTGSHYKMGYQHAQKVQDLRTHITRTMHQRLETLDSYQSDLQIRTSELASAWEEVTRSTMEMLRGIAEGLELEWEPFFRYTIASYLEDYLRRTSNAEGCTVWAAAKSVTPQGAPILVKNRDYRPDHQALQCLARARPAQGYRYAYITSAGSPGVFSSGMNEVGLALADTHVVSRDIGLGLARYSVMMELLEHHGNVTSALDYLRSVTHLGDGTLTITDANGDLAVFEAGHSNVGIVRPENDFVVSTNHFVTAPLRASWVDSNPPELQGNSQNRHAKVAAMLKSAQGQVDTVWAKELMASHGEPNRAICHHIETQPRSATISTALFFPQERTFLIADGQPCKATFQEWSVI